MAGTGTELKTLLRRFGIRATGSCQCEKYAKLMDQRGPEWCSKNIEFLIDVLEESAEQRGLPFARFVGKKLIQIAIIKARKRSDTLCDGATE